MKMIYLGTVLLFQAGSAFANTFSQADSPVDPIVVDAESGLKCDQNKRKCTAFDAVVTQVDKTLKAQKVSVYFSDGDKHIGGDLEKVSADQDVKIKSADDFRASGDHADFDLIKGIVTLKGHAYAHDLQRDQQIKADKIVLKLKKDTLGKTQVDWAEAHRNVHVRTPKTVARSKFGRYDGKTETVRLKGDVKLTQESGQLNGREAIMDLKTGKNQVLSGKKKPVRILLAPSK